MQERQYPFYSGLWNGFYNRDFYASVATRWKWQGFALLLVAVVISLIPTIYVIHSGLKEFYGQELPFILRQLPVVTVENGQASSAAESPSLIYSQSGELIAMVDTTGEHTDPIEANVKVLVTRDYMMFVRNDTEIRSFAFRDAGDMVITETMLQELADSLRPWLMPVTAVFMLIGAYIWRMIQTLVCGLVGLLIARVLGMQMPFSGIMQVVMVALSVVILINFAAGFFGVNLPVLIAIVFTLFFIWFGMKSARDWARMQSQVVSDADINL